MAARLPDSAHRAPQCADNKHWKAMYLNHGRVLKDRNVRVPSRVSQATVVENARAARAFPRCPCQQTRTPRAGFTQAKPQKCGRDARLSERAIPPVTNCGDTYGKKMPAIGHTERRFPVRQSQQRRTGGGAFAGELSGKTRAGRARFQGSSLSWFGPPRTAMRRQ